MIFLKHPLHIEYAGHSEIGPVRDDNQDSICLPEDGRQQPAYFLCAVADGMGGYAQGKQASILAVEKLSEMFLADPHHPAKSLQRGVESANLVVYQTAQKLGVGRMGTTMTALAVMGSKAHIVHVGDSRAYLIRAGKAICLTNDHTTVGDLVRMRILSSDRIRSHAQRSILTRAVGLGLFIQPDLIEVKLDPGDRLVLCSDGVWSVIQDDEFGILAEQTGDINLLSQILVNLAITRQNDDNASVISIHVHNLSYESSTSGFSSNRLASFLGLSKRNPGSSR